MQMKRRPQWKMLLTVLLAVMMVWLAGCEAVGGTDLNQVLVDNLKRESYEGKGVVSLKLIPNEEAQEPLLDDMLELLGHEMTVRFDDMRVKNQSDMYIKGSFVYAQGEIGFAMYSEAGGFAIQLDGYSEPIVFNNAMLAEDAEDVMIDMQQLQEQLLSIQEELLVIIGEYAIARFPNPEIITIEEASTTIQDEELQATKIHMEIPSNEMFGLLQQFVANIVADEEGLRQLIGALYDLIIPVVKEHMGEQLEADPMTAALIDNREFVVEMIFSSIHQGLASVAEDIESGLDEAASALHPDSGLTLDYYLDEEHQIRKSEMKLLIKPADAGDADISAIEITSSEQYWNINGDVVLPTMNTREGISFMDMDNEYEFIKNVDKSSDLYELLRAAGATEKELYIFVADTHYATNAYVEDGTPYVPIRYVSEELYADVDWNHERKQITIDDHPTGTVIILTVGDDTVQLNGEAMNWEQQLKDDSLFVPVSDLAEALNVQWEYDDEVQIVVFTREF